MLRQLALATMLLALLPVHTMAGEVSGRLFFTPEERMALDRARTQNQTLETRQNQPQNGLLKLDGVIKRSDGKQIFWVNGRAVVNGADAGDPYIGNTPATATQELRMPLSNQAYRIKVGQSLNPVTGQARESYQLPRSAAEEATAASATQGSNQP